MITRSWKTLNIFFLLTYLLLSTSICLFHTEPPFGYDPLCPACRFQNSALAIVQIDLFQLPIPTVFEILELASEIPIESVTHIPSTARSPPLV